MKLLKLRLTKRTDTAPRKLMKVRCGDDEKQQQLVEEFKKEFQNLQLLGRKIVYYGPNYQDLLAEFGGSYRQEVWSQSGKDLISSPERREAEFCYYTIGLKTDGTMEFSVQIRKNLKHWIWWRDVKNVDEEYQQKFKQGDYAGVKNAFKKLEVKAKKWKKELEKEERNFLASIKPTEREKDFAVLKKLRLHGKQAYVSLENENLKWSLYTRNGAEVYVWAQFDPYDGDILISQAGSNWDSRMKKVALFERNEPIHKVIDFLKKKYENNKYK